MLKFVYDVDSVWSNGDNSCYEPLQVPYPCTTFFLLSKEGNQDKTEKVSLKAFFQLSGRISYFRPPPPPLSPFRRRLLSATNAHAGGLFPNAHYQDPWLKKNTCQVDQTSNTSKLSLSCFPPTVSLSLCFFVCTSLARPYNSSSNLGQPRTLLFILQNQLYTLAGFELGSSE